MPRAPARPRRRPRAPRAPRASAAGGAGVLVLGEVLCDLFPPAPGVSFREAAQLVPLLGGAPANVAVQCARLGARTALVSVLGGDPLGDRLLRLLAEEGVDVSRVARRPPWRTGVTLVEVDPDGERRFYPLADRRADLAVTVDDVDAAFVGTFGAVHTGTVGLREPKPRAAHEKLVKVARAAGCLVSLDVNLRWAMYRSRYELLGQARRALRRADVVKATADEARALVDAGARTGPATLARRLLAAAPGVKLVSVTLDAGGAVVANRAHLVAVPAPAVDVVDATGAGDAFVGAALVKLLALGRDPADLDEDGLASVGRAACAAGSAACTALGATTGMVRSFSASRQT